MRILYIDIDSLRPDHLGCYGYHRKTSPNIDRIASEGVRFSNCYCSDAPCLPSRTALFGGRFGIHSGVINHGGVAGQPFIEGRERAFRDRLDWQSWMGALRRVGFHTATVSSFGERHSAWHWYAGFMDMVNPGHGGMDSAEQVTPLALDWLRRKGAQDNWFLHVNLWDPHTPYRAPADYGEPFADEPLPAWLTEEVRRQHWQGCGPHSAREVGGFDEMPGMREQYPRQPYQIDSMDEVRRMFDGYDTGIRYADDHVGQLLNQLADLGVLEETVVIVTADHGENLGELNIYGDHQLADNITTRIPLILRWPGITDSQAGRADDALHYHLDFAASLIELAGGTVPEGWDGRSFAPAFRESRDEGREFLVVSQGAWSCQRSVRFEDYLCVRSYHDGYHGFPDIMLFNVAADPHEQNDLAGAETKTVDRALAMLDAWMGEMMETATHPQDPLWTVLHEGGPLHTRDQLPVYRERLRATGRGAWADRLAQFHPREARP